jgi:hypothetical protein
MAHIEMIMTRPKLSNKMLSEVLHDKRRASVTITYKDFDIKKMMTLLNMAFFDFTIR